MLANSNSSIWYAVKQVFCDQKYRHYYYWVVATCEMGNLIHLLEFSLIAFASLAMLCAEDNYWNFSTHKHLSFDFNHVVYRFKGGKKGFFLLSVVLISSLSYYKYFYGHIVTTIQGEEFLYIFRLFFSLQIYWKSNKIVILIASHARKTCH